MIINTSHKQQSEQTRHENLLVRIGSSKDKNAFIELFHYFTPRIKSYFLKHGTDTGTAEEIAQNTMIAVWEKAHSYDPSKATASTWIFTIARHKRIDALRKEKFVITNSESPAVENARTENIEEYADNNALNTLSSALKDLPKEQSQLIHMAFFEDMSHRAIAHKTRLPLGTVKSRLRLALEKLRHKLRILKK